MELAISGGEEWRRGESNPAERLLHDGGDARSRAFRRLSVVEARRRRARRQDFGRMNRACANQAGSAKPGSAEQAGSVL